MRIARSHCDCSMPQQMLNRDEVHAFSYQPGRERVTQVVKPNFWYASQTYCFHKSNLWIAKTFARPSMVREHKVGSTPLRKVGKQLGDRIVHWNTSFTRRRLAVVKVDKGYTKTTKRWAKDRIATATKIGSRRSFWINLVKSLLRSSESVFTV